jgi:hypothetical protein
LKDAGAGVLTPSAGLLNQELPEQAAPRYRIERLGKTVREGVRNPVVEKVEFQMRHKPLSQVLFPV